MTPMNRRSVILGLALSLVIPSIALSAEGQTIKRSDFEKAARVCRKEPYTSRKKELCAARAVLMLFPDLQAEYERSLAKLTANQSTRLRGESIESLVESHKSDIQVREEFGFSLTMSAIELRTLSAQYQEVCDSLLDEADSAAATFKERSRAFDAAVKLIEEFAAVVGSTNVKQYEISWPDALPFAAREVFAAGISRVLYNDDAELRHLWYERLWASANQIRQEHNEAQARFKLVRSLRKSLDTCPSRVIREIGYQIDHCIKKNEDANDLSRVLVKVVTGEMVPDSADQETLPTPVAEPSEAGQ